MMYVISRFCMDGDDGHARSFLFCGWRGGSTKERVQLVKNYPSCAGRASRLRRRFAWAVPPFPLCLLAATLGTTVGCHNKQATQSVAQPAQHLDFNQDVQPILASNCFSCHGPDPEMRKAGLRLDLEESAFRKRPGHPEKRCRKISGEHPFPHSIIHHRSMSCNCIPI